jgi:hypothetical protein
MKHETQWEYWTPTIHAQKLKEPETLDAAGKDGWELVAVQSLLNSDTIQLFFKRPAA